MDIQALRQEIDSLDQELVALFCKRMEQSKQVALYKKENNLPIFVPEREAAVLDRVAELAGTELAEDAKALYRKIFELSRSYQSKFI